MKPTLLVLAAGIGSRYGGLKQIEPLGPTGELIIDYSVYDAARAGFGKVVFVIRREMEEAFSQAISAKFEQQLSIQFAYQDLNDLPPGFSAPAERTKPWGTAHALLSARRLVQEPFAVLNADDYYGPSAFKSMVKFLSSVDLKASVPAYALIGFLLRNTLSEHGGVARALCECDAHQKLQRVTEMLKIIRTPQGAANLNADETRTELTGNEWISMNMWGFTPRVFEQFASHFTLFLQNQGGELKAEFLAPQVMDTLIRTGAASVQVIPSTDSWYGVTYQEDRPWVMAGLRALHEKGEYPSPLWRK